MGNTSNNNGPGTGLLVASQTHGIPIIRVILDNVDEEEPVDITRSFYLLANFVPRVGEQLRLDNGRVCNVDQVRFVFGEITDYPRADGVKILMPSVYAVLRPEEPEQTADESK